MDINLIYDLPSADNVCGKLPSPSRIREDNMMRCYKLSKASFYESLRF